MGKNGHKEMKPQEAGAHPKDLMGPVNDTRESIEAYAKLHNINIETALQLFILDELRRIDWSLSEMLIQLGNTAFKRAGEVEKEKEVKK